MAQIFISHSSRDEELVNKFVDLLETGLGIRGSDTIFASSIPGRDIEMGNVNQQVKQALIDAKLAIFILSPNFYESHYCMAEMGAAWITDKKVFIFTVPSLDRGNVKAVFDGMQSEQLHADESLDKLADVLSRNGIERDDPGLARWNRKRNEFIKWLGAEYEASAGSKSRIEDLPEWRDRGHWSTSIVDSTMYVGSDRFVDVNVTAKIIATIDRGLVMPTVYAYLTDTGFHNWIRLTEDASYTYYRDSLELVEDTGLALAERIAEVAGGDSLDLISLGPGDGAKDAAILRALTERFDPSGLHYYPFDINPSMISRAVGTISRVPRLRQIGVKAILAEFDSLPQFAKIYQYRAAPNLLTLLGNTLGNLSDERAFLEQIHGGSMSKGDMLLLDVRRRYDSGGIRLRSDANKEFDFGPLEMVGIPFDPEKLHYSSVGDSSLVPNTSTVLAAYESMSYQGEEYKDIKLGLIHEYDPDAVRSVCEGIGFETLAQEEHCSATALLLLKK